MNAISQLTSNQYYGAMNKRFNTRAAKLYAMGYRYRIICKGVAAFTYREGSYSERNIAAAEVMHAHNRGWREVLATAGRH